MANYYSDHPEIGFYLNHVDEFDKVFDVVLRGFESCSFGDARW